MPFDATGGLFPAIQMRRVLFLLFRKSPPDDRLYGGARGLPFYSLKFGSIKSKNEPVIFSCSYWEHLKTSVFRCFLTLWRKLPSCNYLYYNKLAIFSEELPGTQPGFPEVPYWTCS
jgi:hypothetical protein